MVEARELDRKELLNLLEAPGMRNELSRTITNQDKPFDDGRDYPQERVDAVTHACLSSLKKAL